MENKFSKPLILFAVIAVGLCAVLFAITFESSGAGLHEDGVSSAIELRGIYSVDGGEPHVLTSGTQFGARHTVKFHGHFSRDIGRNELIYMQITNLHVQMKINGEEIFTTAAPELLPPSASPLEPVWKSFISHGIQMDDTIEFELYNVADNNDPMAFHNFLYHMNASVNGNLYLHMIEEKGRDLFLGLFSGALGFGMFMVAFFALHLHMEGARRLLFLSFLVISGGVWILFSGTYPYLPLLVPYPVLAHLVALTSIHFGGFFILAYLKTFLNGKFQTTVGIFEYIALFLLSAGVLLQILDVKNYAEMQRFIAPILVAELLSAFGMALWKNIGRNIRSIFFSLLSFIPLSVGLIADTMHVYGKSDAYVYTHGVGIKIGFIIVVIVQFFSFIILMKRSLTSMLLLQKLENELLENKISIMLSQIQPHFLYNVLNTISSLCLSDPMKAREATNEFSYFLRGNLDSISSSALIFFDYELKHVQAYLSLEKKRFGERLTIVYDLACREFRLPVLTLQPIVENAVRYGVTKKANGGTIIIATRETADAVILSVSDDGCGFDPAAPPADGKTHIGIINVKSRVERQCGGTLVIDSAVGRGTIVTITLPKQSKKNG